MLLPKNTNPAFSVYYYGAIVLRALLSNHSHNSTVDFLELFQAANKLEKISIQSFTLTLDWLFLIGTIESDEDGVIRVCF
jgi:hypothetical protein